MTAEGEKGKRLTTASESSFQLFPHRFEHVVLGQPGGIVLLALGPLALLLMVRALEELLNPVPFDWRAATSDLRDPIFVLVSLSFLISGLIFSRYWYVQVGPAWRSLIETLDRTRIDSTAFRIFKANFRARLHSRKRYLPVICFLFLAGAFSFSVLSGRSLTLNRLTEGVNDPLLVAVSLTHVATRWFLPGIFWSYFGGVGIWAMWVNGGATTDFFNRFEPDVHPYHSDRCGGFKKVGDLSGSLIILAAVLFFPIVFFGARGLLKINQGLNCLTIIQTIPTNVPPVPPAALIECMESLPRSIGWSLKPDYLNSLQVGAIDARKAAPGLVIELALKLIKDAAERGVPVGANLDDYEILAREIHRHGRLAYYFSTAAVIFLPLMLWLVGWPLWVIYRYLNEKRQILEQKISGHMIPLDRLLLEQLTAESWDKAARTQTRLEELAKFTPDAIGFPRWPLQIPSFLPKLIAPATLSAFLSFMLTFVPAGLTPRVQAFFEIVANLLD